MIGLTLAIAGDLGSACIRVRTRCEFAEAAAFLLSNRYVNGEVLRLDGAQRFQPNCAPEEGPQRYHRKMIRYFAGLRTLVVMALITGCSAGVSHASPSGDEGTGQCSFILTPPKVVQISGLSVVLASLHPGPCPMEAEPNSSVICLSVAGTGSPGECASMNGRNPAQVRYPYQPGTTYIVKAEGCASLFQPPYTLCQNFGPSQVTL